jgi:hypothetical protein
MIMMHDHLTNDDDDMVKWIHMTFKKKINGKGGGEKEHEMMDTNDVSCGGIRVLVHPRYHTKKKPKQKKLP